LHGGVAAVADGWANMEVLTCTVTLTAANVPTCTLGAETTNYPTNCSLVNSLTGDKIYIKTPMLVNTEIVIDTDARTVTVNGKANYGIMTLSSVRNEWFPLTAGSDNKITFNNPGTGNVTLTIVHSDRATL
jgi:hypothetical protein